MTIDNPIADLVRVIATSLAEDEVTDGHRFEAERVLKALGAAGYEVRRADGQVVS
jgi:hypothetical protein